MPSPPIPILLLKSPSEPSETDSYTQLFSSPSSTSPILQPPQAYTYNPIHIPVLTHAFDTAPLLPVLSIHPFPYGGLIFTSQRAVSAFALALNQTVTARFYPTDWLDWNFPIYAVGPATTKAIKGVCAQYLPACGGNVIGEEAGTGEALARIILEHYNDRWGVKKMMMMMRESGGGGKKKALLFLTGEVHRDIVPLMLRSSTLPPEQRIEVEEMVVYRTTPLSSFPASFAQVLDQTDEETNRVGARWIVVFSVTGGEEMLRGLGWLDEKTGRVRDDWKEGGRMTFVASIGPTTREYLRKEFGFEVDVCAERPSAESVREGIKASMREAGIAAGDGNG